jgi:hypothetical protein
MKPFCLLVFMAADSDMDEVHDDDLREMMRVGSGPSLVVAVEVDRRGAFSFEKETDRKRLRSVRLVVEPNRLSMVEDLGETNTGDPQVLERFLKWGMSAFEAQRYGLVIWNHGGGVKDEDIYQRLGGPMKRPLFGQPKLGLQVRWVARDDTSRDFLDMIELKKALSGHRRLDFIGFDACLMSMFEVAYQLREATDYVVGSQENEPKEGWPYAEVLAHLASAADVPTRDVTGSLVAAYIQRMVERGERATQSAISTDCLEDVAQAIDALAQGILEAFDTIELEMRRLIPHRLQRFRDRDYVDVLHFARICEGFGHSGIRSSSERLRAALRRAVTANLATGEKLEEAHGLSILFPAEALEGQVLQMYQRLDFVRRYPHWLNLIQTFYGGTVTM